MKIVFGHHASRAACLAAVGGADHDAAVVGGREAVHLAQQDAQQPPRSLVHVAAARAALRVRLFRG